MYIEKLQTPHPNAMVPGQMPTPLIEAIGADEAREYLTDSSIPAPLALFEVIDHTTGIIRQSLRYPEFEDDEAGAAQKEEFEVGGYDSLSDLTNAQVTSCKGYTVVGSECLELIGIEHEVCYMAGHWFITVPFTGSDGSLRLQLADMYKPGKLDPLSQDLTDAVRSPWAGMFIEEIRSGGQSAAKVDVSKFAGNLGKTSSLLASDYSWLEQYGRGQILNPDTEDAQAFIMTGYSSDRGRSVIEHYADFNIALARGEMMSAAGSLQHLEGSYPELDARAKHDQIFKLVQGLGEIGELAVAARSISGYFAGIGQRSKDPRLNVAEGDAWRDLSRMAVGTGLGYAALELARSAYNTAANRTAIEAYRMMCLGKVANLATLFTF